MIHGIKAIAPAVIKVNKICAQLDAGMSTDDAAKQLGIEGQIWGPQIVSAAQHDLCPKTLPAQ